MRASIRVALDASRCRSGGAVAHIKGILNNFDPTMHDIDQIHLWAYKKLADSIPDYPWLVKHSPAPLRSNLLHQMFWQATDLEKEIKQNGCDILLTADASTLCRFKPQVVISQDLLSYEPGMMKKFGWSVDRSRLLAKLWIQNRAFQRAQGVIFLTEYASQVVIESCGELSHFTYIPHGVDQIFQDVSLKYQSVKDQHDPIQCLYVSNTAMYKHQWEVVRAVESLRNEGFDINLVLVGGGEGKAQKLLEAQMDHSDPYRTFVRQEQFIPHSQLPQYHAQADLFIFASSCENMPVTLVEAMAAGLPIACSDRGPMPEVLQKAGLYFDPEDYNSIAATIRRLIVEPELRMRLAERARVSAQQYSWSRCASETWSFVAETFRRNSSYTSL